MEGVNIGYTCSAPTDWYLSLPKLLIIEDEVELAVKLKKLLDEEGFTTDLVHDGLVGAAMLEQYQFDLIIVDWNLPGLQGPEIIEQFRSRGGNTPIIMLTGESDLKNKEVGFEAGADDYLTKPFAGKELILRLKALLRRPVEFKKNVLQLGPLQLDVDASVATVGDEPLNLQRLEYRLLEFLMRNNGKTYTAEMLLDRVWPADSEASVETVRGYIKTLRKKLGAVCSKPCIRNIYGLGYKIDLSNE